ncbi:MAG: hypothetical protein PF517_18820 [Salinivirgaceae bacterium]|jgi:hypothetical protein|nr:hypothetical protein [Salinivirgaceae bacterium]
MAAFGLFNEPKNIIELFTFDLTTFFIEDDYEEISCIEEEGVFMIEYEKELPWTELGLFNSVIFRVFNDKKNIIGSNHINVRLVCEIGNELKPYIVKLVHKLNKIYGYDDDNSGDWSNADDVAFEEGSLIRQWTLGEGKFIYTVKFRIKNNEAQVEILFFNHLLELLK